MRKIVFLPGEVPYVGKNEYEIYLHGTIRRRQKW